MSYPSRARAYLGLALLGWGLSIVLQVAPHEDPFVGAGLIVAGTALVFTAPTWPRFEHVRASPVIFAGAVALGLVIGYDYALHAPLNLTKIAILAYASLLMVAGALLQVLGRGSTLRGWLSTGVVCSIPVVAAPLVIWSFQAAFKRLLGSTPIETFVHYALLLPAEAALTAIGWNPTVEGSTITYTTVGGALAIDIGAACSGVQAMALFGGVIALYLFLERPVGRSVAVWIAIGILGVYLANLMRIMVLLAVGYRWGPDALIQVHEQAGWVFFVAWSMTFAGLVRTGGPRPWKPAKGARSPPALAAFKE